jgi:hypothetical protein
LPQTHHTIPPPRGGGGGGPALDFVATLARAGKRWQEIKSLVDSAYGKKNTAK